MSRTEAAVFRFILDRHVAGAATADYHRPWGNLACGLSWCGCRVLPFLWLSHRHRAAFVEVPKCGTVAIKEVLGTGTHFKMAARAAGEAVARDNARVEVRHGEATAGMIPFYEEMVERFAALQPAEVPALSPEEGFFPFYGDVATVRARYPDYRVFTVVRHPLDRFLSAFRMFCREPSPLRRQQACDTLGVDDPEALSAGTFADLALERPNHHWQPLHHFVPVADGRPRVDTVLHLETIAETWPPLARRLGVSPALPVRNATPADAAPLPASVRRRLESFYADDLAAFGYG